jgi:hypothetical protein
MILLTSTSDIIEVITSGSAAIHAHASYVDLSSGVVTPNRTNTPVIASATTTTLVASPGGSTQRNVKMLSLYNADASASNTLTIEHYDGTTTITLKKFVLLAGYTMTWTGENGWQLTDNNGAIVTAPTPGRFLKSTLLTSGTTFTTGAQTNTIKARMVAGGGQGGGNAATLGTCGGGGGSGSYAEYVASVTPSTNYTYAIGAGGSTGGTGANGQAGGNTTLTVGATTVTCNGGSGGIEGTSISVPVLGGAGGTISTNGTLNIPGDPGEPCITTGTAGNNRSGAGAPSMLGAGAASILEATNSTGNSAASLGYGGGGGGSATSAGTARAGGAAAPGCIIIDEYS